MLDLRRHPCFPSWVQSHGELSQKARVYVCVCLLVGGWLLFTHGLRRRCPAAREGDTRFGVQHQPAPISARMGRTRGGGGGEDRKSGGGECEHAFGFQHHRRVLHERTHGQSVNGERRADGYGLTSTVALHVDKGRCSSAGKMPAHTHTHRQERTFRRKKGGEERPGGQLKGTCSVSRHMAGKDAELVSRGRGWELRGAAEGRRERVGVGEGAASVG